MKYFTKRFVIAKSILISTKTLYLRALRRGMAILLYRLPSLPLCRVDLREGVLKYSTAG